MNIFVFTGAGASYELGVPTMGPMVDEFWTYLSRTTLNEDEIELLRDDIEDPEKDMEAIIQHSRRIVAAENSSNELYADIGGPGRVTLFQKLQREAEWFVQNVCRRVDLTDAELLWEPTLSALNEREATIVTSNYDRGIEVAADAAGISLHDGFEEFWDNETAEWVGLENQESVELLKMHGSLDWFQTDTDIIKLRHPLSVYGDIEINVGHSSELDNCLILPSKEKQMLEEPFTSIDTRMKRAAYEADIAIFIGSSLRDPDIASLVEDCVRRIPTYIVSPQAKKNNRGADHIQAKASEFLISILPAALATDSLQRELDKVAEKNRDAPAILESINNLYNSKDEERIDSIEYLAENRISLPSKKVKKLLKEEDPRVRKYALALVAESFDPSKLKDTIETLEREDPNKSVQDEAKLLLKHTNL